MRSGGGLGPGYPFAVAKEVVEVRSVDRAATVWTVIGVLATGWAVFSSVTQFMHGRWGSGLFLIAEVLLFCLITTTWWWRRSAMISADAAGLTRDGRFGWHLPWSAIQSAEVHDVSSIGGRQSCLTLRIAPSAMTGRLPNSASISRMFRVGHPKGRNVLVVPLGPDAHAFVAAVRSNILV